MAANINATECNTLPVLYNIHSSTVILPQHQEYMDHLHNDVTTSRGFLR